LMNSRFSDGRKASVPTTHVMSGRAGLLTAT
jgi:hypothetical protein